MAVLAAAIAEIVAAAGLALAAVIALQGPLHLAGGWLRIGSPTRAAVAGGIALIVALGLRGPRVADCLFRITCGAIGIAVSGLVLSSLVTACGGLDSAGYLGAADLLRHGHVTEDAPLARVLPFPDAIQAASPLGWTPSALPGRIAPEFPLGLPLVMAVGLAVAGAAAPFAIAPLLGAATAVLTFLTMRRQFGATVAATCACLLALSPIFIDLSLQPMSDVPAAFWIALTAFALWRPSPLAAVGGIAAGTAVLTRPPLLLAALALAATTAWPRRRLALRFLVVVLAFVAMLMVLQSHMFGSALTSGHGSAGRLFTLDALPHNGSAQVKWLTVSQSPAFLALLAAGAVRRPRFALRAAIVAGAVAVPYVFYVARFDDWEMTRFLLPALPILCGVAAASLTWFRPPDQPMARVAATAVLLAATAWSFAFLQQHRVLTLEQQERRYPQVAAWFNAQTGSRGVPIASLHSGSLKYYTRRPVVRIDAIPEDRMLAAVRSLEAAGYEPYLVLETGDEMDAYYRRFRPDRISQLHATPLARVSGVNIIRLDADSGFPSR